jgi:hypothetical protein
MVDRNSVAEVSLPMSTIGSVAQSWLSDFINERRLAAARSDAAIALTQPVAGNGTWQRVDNVEVTPPGGDSAYGGGADQRRLPTDLSMMLIFMQTGGPANGTTPSAAAASPTGGNGTSAPGSFLGDLKSLLASTLSGDAKAATEAATSLKAGLQKAASNGNSNAVADASAGVQHPFLGDFTKLIDAAQAGDATAAQEAAGTLAKNIESIVGQHQQAVHPAMDAAGSSGRPPASYHVETGGPLAAAKRAYEMLISFAEGVG